MRLNSFRLFPELLTFSNRPSSHQRVFIAVQHEHTNGQNVSAVYKTQHTFLTNIFSETLRFCTYARREKPSEGFWIIVWPFDVQGPSPWGVGDVKWPKPQESSIVPSFVDVLSWLLVIVAFYSGTAHNVCVVLTLKYWVSNNICA